MESGSSPRYCKGSCEVQAEPWKNGMNAPEQHRKLYSRDEKGAENLQTTEGCFTAISSFAVTGRFSDGMEVSVEIPLWTVTLHSS